MQICLEKLLNWSTFFWNVSYMQMIRKKICADFFSVLTLKRSYTYAVSFLQNARSKVPYAFFLGLSQSSVSGPFFKDFFYSWRKKDLFLKGSWKICNFLSREFSRKVLKWRENTVALFPNGKRPLSLDDEKGVKSILKIPPKKDLKKWNSVSQ